MKKTIVLIALSLLMAGTTCWHLESREVVNITNMSLEQYLAHDPKDVAVQKNEVQQEPKKIGRLYYDALLDQATTKRWALPITFNYAVATKGYKDCNNRVPLAQQVFRTSCITIGDIFLLSKLAGENKIRRNNKDALQPERPQGDMSTFGCYESDQYIALLAPTKLNIDVEQRELLAHASAIYRCHVPCTRALVLAFGVDVPVKSLLHIMELQFCDNPLFAESHEPGSMGETAKQEFQEDFDSLEDNKVTARDRDTLKQERIAIDQIESYLAKLLK